MKKGANITSGALQDLFEKFYRTDFYNKMLILLILYYFGFYFRNL